MCVHRLFICQRVTACVMWCAQEDLSNQVHDRNVNYIVPVQCSLEHLQWLNIHQVKSQITQ